LKRIEPSHRLCLAFFYVIHPRRARTFLQTHSQSGQLLVSSHGEHFDAAIRIVAHPSGNLQDVRLTLDKPAKADALNTATHEKAASLR